jgi:osmotically-inducible protein OsmY
VQTAAPPQSDAELRRIVRAELYNDDTVRGAYIDVGASEGVVTLDGRAHTDIAKRRALEIAQSVDGVTRVEDRLVVAPAPPLAARGTTAAADDTTPLSWITTRVQAQYFVHPDIKPWNIDVTTSPGGVVELHGEVDTSAARTEAVRIARATDGVTNVEDHLRVRADGGSPAQAINDAWLTTSVRARFFLDDDVRGRDVDVSTQNGVVSLRGTVSSERERRQAVAVARNTDGVREVADQLEVRAPGGADDTPRATAGREAADVVGDAWITTKVQAQYFLDPLVKAHEIDVDTRNGVVTLDGRVSSEDARAAAEAIARDTAGVTRVRNQLTVGAEP